MSTRRFCERPSAVSLVAMGRWLRVARDTQTRLVDAAAAHELSRARTPRDAADSSQLEL